MGTALIEANIFDYYRHAIAGSGLPGTGYEARYNFVGPRHQPRLRYARWI